MDLGLSGKTAIVCASSEGLGFASAMSLARAGCHVVMNGRRPDVLARAAGAVRDATGANIVTVVADVSTAEGRQSLISICGAPDILVNNAGGPPKKDFRELTKEDWQSALDTNMLAAISLITHYVDGMIERRFGRIVNVTSMTAVRPAPNLDLSNAARLGLTGFCAGVSRQVAGANVTINNLLPGAFATGRAKALASDEQLEAICATIPAGRLGDPAEFGEACAFLCSAAAGYITGQSLLIDGGFCHNVN